MGQYRPMFNISMEHTYFSNGRFSGVKLVPTVESAKIMANANLVARKRNDGVTFFFDNDYIDTLRLYAGDEDDPLRINLECDVEDQNFQNFTIASVFGDNKTLYFDSTNTDQQEVGKKYLHAEEYVSPADLVEIFTGPHGLKENHGSVLSFSENRALLFDAEQTEKNPAGKTRLDPDDANGNVALTRDLLRRASPADRRQPGLGLVSIRVTRDELEELTQAPLNVYNDYHIKFRARETHWKYFITGDADREGVFITDVNGEIDFDYLGEEELANGRRAKVFLSKQAIPMSERAKPRFQLKITQNSHVKVLVRRLAVPSAKRINRVKAGDSELFVSEVYVNF